MLNFGLSLVALSAMSMFYATFNFGQIWDRSQLSQLLEAHLAEKGPPKCLKFQPTQKNVFSNFGPPPWSPSSPSWTP